MELTHYKQNLQKFSLDYVLNSPASPDEIELTETRLCIEFPQKVREFYSAFNGFKVATPRLDVFPLEELSNESGIIEFSIFDGVHKLAWDSTSINRAGQWNIVNSETGYVVTLSMSSFWADKVWAWLRKQRTIWQNEQYS